MRSDSIGLFWEDAAKIKAEKAVKIKRPAPPRTWELPGYLPDIHEAVAYRYMEMTDAQILEAHARKEELIFDIECYINYFLIAFQCKNSGLRITFEFASDFGIDCDRRKLEWIVHNFTLVSFNGIKYDIPILAIFLAGKSNKELKGATNLIIGSKKDPNSIKMRPQDVLKLYKVKRLRDIDHIDLIEVAPLQASLKIYAGRVHGRRMQDLPFAHDAVLSVEQIAILKWYCCNDLANTVLIRNELNEQIKLRIALSEEYRVDVRSKSDAQIAEALISSEVDALSGYRAQKPTIAPGTVFYYNPPSFLKYQSELMNWVLHQVRQAMFIIQEDGTIGLPPVLADMDVNINKSVYKMGIGGLHSTEKKAAHIATSTVKIKDIDFDSFYPKIIIGQNLFPPHLGMNFIRVYERFVNRRLAAKAAKDKITSNSLKIVINGSFGKLGSPFSILYAPELLIQTTITGQLILLMFIERLELAGIQVVSANTDGIVSLVPTHMEHIFQEVVKSVQRDTGFTTEETEYSALYSRDVNNYIAVKVPDKEGKVKLKGKGVFGNPWHPDNKDDAIFRFHKNPVSLVCVDAIYDLLKYNKPIGQTIRECKDITKFITVRKVNEGAVKPYRKPDAPLYEYERLEYLGESIRWYYSTNADTDIIIAKNGNSVPKSMGAMPLMALPENLPNDIDYEWYERETEVMLKSIAYFN